METHTLENVPEYETGVAATLAGQDHDALRTSLDRLNELSQLEAGWDYYDGRAISPVAIEMSTRLLFETARRLRGEVSAGVEPSFIAPLANGGILLEWSQSSCGIEVSIAPDQTIGYLLTIQNGNEQHFEEADSIDLREAIDRVCRLLAE